MKFLEQKGERFVIKADIPIYKFDGKSPTKFKRVYGADIVIKHNDRYLFLEYLEQPKYEVIDDKGKVQTEHQNQISDGSG